MCACNGTGVIQNDMGSGMYQFVGCICAAGERSREELDHRRQVITEKIELAYQMHMEGTWDAEAHRRYTEGRLHDSSAAKEVHEEIAS